MGLGQVRNQPRPNPNANRRIWNQLYMRGPLSRSRSAINTAINPDDIPHPNCETNHVTHCGSVHQAQAA